MGLARQAAQLAIEHGSHSEIIGWLKQFIIQHKEIVIMRNQDSMERSEVQVDNKENESNKLKSVSFVM